MEPGALAAGGKTRPGVNRPQEASIKARARREGARMARFGAVGLANTATDFALFSALILAGVAPTLANGAGFLAANLQSYLVNARVTFGEKGAPAPVSFSGYGKFAGAHILSLVFSTAMILVLSDRIGPFAAKAAGALFTFLWNYWSSAFFIFRAGKENAS